MAKVETSPEIKQLDEWLKEGALARDTGSKSPGEINTIRHFMNITGWVKRDLQLALCRAKPGYRNSQLACGNITEEGIRGGYGFDARQPYKEA